MSTDPLPPKARRPEWRLPRPLAVGAWIVSVLVGLIGLFPEVGGLPIGIRAVVVGLPIVTAGWWALPKIAREFSVTRLRLTWYDRVYARMEHELARADKEALSVERERIRVATISMSLTAAVVHRARYRLAVFRVTSPRLQDEEVVVSLYQEDMSMPVIPRSGEVLTLVDRGDGKWQGTLEVLPHRSLSGELLASIIDADPVLLSFLNAKAIVRADYTLDAVAVYIRTAEGVADG